MNTNNKGAENMNTKRNFRLGDTVSGFYHDVPFVGVIVSWDGGTSIDLTAPITVCGTERDGVYIGRHDYSRANLTLVQAGPELTEEQVVHFQGHMFLRK